MNFQMLKSRDPICRRVIVARWSPRCWDHWRHHGCRPMFSTPTFLLRGCWGSIFFFSLIIWYEGKDIFLVHIFGFWAKGTYDKQDFGILSIHWTTGDRGQEWSPRRSDYLVIVRAAAGTATSEENHNDQHQNHAWKTHTTNHYMLNML